MKLFKSLLIAPATLGLLAPLPSISSEIDFQSISKYSNAEYEIDSNTFNYSPTNNTLLSGGEGLVESSSSDSFSSTTTASFSAEAILGGVSSDLAVSEAVSFDYQYQIGLTSSFTGEDTLSVTIDAAGPSGVAPADASGDDVAMSESAMFFGMDSTDDALVVDGITYTFPVGASTMMVGDSTDISAMYTGACAYGGFSDYISDCGTGNSIGLGGVGATVAGSYAFDGGFTLAAGVSSPNTEVLGEGIDAYGIEAAYTADDYGVSLAFSDVETSTYVGLNGYYTFDFATISAGYETEDIDEGTDASAFFVGLTKEVGPGTAELGYASTDMATGLTADGTTGYLYEVSYAYPVNDALTITPGIAIVDTDAGETTTAAVKASFSF